jgi:hypothetical protein
MYIEDYLCFQKDSAPFHKSRALKSGYRTRFGQFLLRISQSIRLIRLQIEAKNFYIQKSVLYAKKSIKKKQCILINGKT